MVYEKMITNVSQSRTLYARIKKNMLYAMLTSTDFFFTEEDGKKC